LARVDECKVIILPITGQPIPVMAAKTGSLDVSDHTQKNTNTNHTNVIDFMEIWPL